MSTAHEHARLALKAGAKALEGDQPPTLEDFKTARDLAKSAHETLKAGCDLLAKGINQVMDEDHAEEVTPPTPPAMFSEDGQPVPEADLTRPAIVCAPYPAPDWMDVEVVDHGEEIAHLLDAWEQFGIEDGRSMKLFIPLRALWMEAFEADALGTISLLRWAMDNVSGCWCDPACADDLKFPLPGEASNG